MEEVTKKWYEDAVNRLNRAYPASEQRSDAHYVALLAQEVESSRKKIEYLASRLEASGKKIHEQDDRISQMKDMLEARDNIIGSQWDDIANMRKQLSENESLIDRMNIVYGEVGDEMLKEADPITKLLNVATKSGYNVTINFFKIEEDE